MSPIKRIFKKAIGVNNTSAEEAHDAQAAAQPLNTQRLRYFFINGHPRSGTNWLSALMNLHPDIYCHGEFHFHILRQAMDGFTSLPWYVAHNEPVRSEAESAFHDLVRRCLAIQATKKPHATVVGDHTPRTMRAFLPDAAYLLIRRDGRDVVTSWTYHLVRTGKPEVVAEPIRHFLETALKALTDSSREAHYAAGRALLANEHWVRHFAASWAYHVQRDEQACVDWREKHYARVLPIRYEDLHADTHAWRARIYEFLGVDPAKARPIDAQSKTAPGFGREDPKSFYRKGEVGDWVNHFTADTERWFMAEAEPALRVLGYLQTPAAHVDSRVPSGPSATAHAVATPAAHTSTAHALQAEGRP